jgi:hypothetical protein
MMDKIFDSIVSVGLSIFGIVVIIVMIIASFAVPIAIAYLIYRLALSI